MTITLRCLKDVPAARLYQNAAGKKVWLPRSLITSCVKYPPDQHGVRVHEIEIPDWLAEEKELP